MMVRPEDTAYHAGEFSLNQESIGIELEDGDTPYLTQSNWARQEQYDSVARLIRCLSEQFSFTPSPQTIVGHSAVSKKGKEDPGKYWNWDKLFELLAKPSGGIAGEQLTELLASSSR